MKWAPTPIQKNTCTLACARGSRREQIAKQAASKRTTPATMQPLLTHISAQGRDRKEQSRRGPSQCTHLHPEARLYAEQQRPRRVEVGLRR